MIIKGRLPGPPRFVRFREFGDDYVTVEWDPPNQARVNEYEITLFDSKNVVRVVSCRLLSNLARIMPSGI